MGKFDERALRMRKERMDLYGDKSVTVVVSRPERPSLSYREAVPSLLSDIASKPPMLCFDVNCKNEVHSLRVFMFIVTDPKSAPLIVAACEACSKKTTEDIIKILRSTVKSHFGIGPAKPSDLVHAPFVESATEQTVAGIQLAIVDGVEGKACRQALFFGALLEDRKLPHFTIAFRGQNNCFSITRQLYLDFKALGIEERFSFKEGFSSLPKTDGQPIGQHCWIELDGWAIDASGGALGNPVLFQRTQDYYSRRIMSEIREVEWQAKS